VSARESANELLNIAYIAQGKLYFKSGDRAVREVWVGGQRVIQDGHHAEERAAAAGFGHVCRRIVYT